MKERFIVHSMQIAVESSWIQGALEGCSSTESGWTKPDQNGLDRSSKSQSPFVWVVLYKVECLFFSLVLGGGDVVVKLRVFPSFSAVCSFLIERRCGNMMTIAL